MPQPEITRRLIKEADFQDATNELERRGILYFTFEKRYRWGEDRYRMLCFFSKEKEQNKVFSTISDLAIKSFKPSQVPERKTYSYDEIYRIMFRETAEDILKRMSETDSILLRKYSGIKKDLEPFLTKMDHALEILGDEFLEVEHSTGRRVRNVKREMERFSRKRPIR